MMKLLLFTTLVSASSALNFMDVVAEEWNTFKTAHRKSYESPMEEKFRMRTIEGILCKSKSVYRIEEKFSR